MNAHKPLRMVAAVLLAGVGLMLGGCDRIQDVTLHEPGVYKGKTDPLVQRLDEPQQQAELEERFRMQTDR